MEARFRGRRPSPSLVISIVALFVALGGTSYAAVSLAKNSVGSKQIKKNAVTSTKVKNGSLKAVDFASGQLPAGPAGPRGLTGATGATGPAGVVGAITVQRTDITLPAGSGVNVPGAATSAFATCLAGQKLVGGSVNVGDPLAAEVLISRPATSNAGAGGIPDDGNGITFWKGTARARSNAAETMRVFAICAQIP